MRASTRNTFVQLCVWISCVCAVSGDGRKSSASPIVQALRPSGLRISLPDFAGLDVVTVSANVNTPIDKLDTAQLTGNILEPRQRFWTLEFPKLTLKPGDVVFYSLYVSTVQSAYRENGHQKIYDLVEPSCEPSSTTVNGRPACQGQLIFEDNFDTLNTSIWKHSIQISDDTDKDFSIYTDSPENSFVHDGLLHIKGTLLQEDDVTTPLTLEKCTRASKDSPHCARKPFGWDILPPSRSAMLTTKGTFGFKYGRIDVRAKTAAGDWLMSRVMLLPSANVYGSGLYESGRIEMSRSRGNPDLLERSGWVLGARLNDPQILIGTCGRVQWVFKNCHLKEGKLYSDEMHTFSLVWTPFSLTFTVDGECEHVVRPPLGGFLQLNKFKDNCHNSPWKMGTYMAPFDKEFYIHFNLLVGGFNTYKNDVVSRGHPKPWQDYDPRALLRFWQKKDEWFPTWTSDMEIDYVKVWAL